MKKEIIEIRKIVADTGYVFAASDKSMVFGNEMYLGCNDSEENYLEITEEEAAQIEEELRKKAEEEIKE